MVRHKDGALIDAPISIFFADSLLPRVARVARAA